MLVLIAVVACHALRRLRAVPHEMRNSTTSRPFRKKAIAFGLDYRAWPIYLDLSDVGSERITIHDDRDCLPRPKWANLEHAYPCAYIAESFGEYIRRLIPDPSPPH